MPSHLDRAQLLMDVHRPKEAARALLDHLAEEPDSAHAHAMLARCYLALNQLRDARAECEQAIHLAPEDAYGHYIHSFVLRDLKRPKEARKAIQEALRLHPDAACYLSQSANLWSQASFYELALADAERGRAIDPLEVECACERAFALMCLQRIKEAEAAVQEILLYEPDHARVHATMGWVALNCWKFSVARQHFTEALRIAPDNEWAREGMQKTEAGSSVWGFLAARDATRPDSLRTALETLFLLFLWYNFLWHPPWTFGPPRQHQPAFGDAGHVFVILVAGIWGQSLLLGRELAKLRVFFSSTAGRAWNNMHSLPTVYAWCVPLLAALILATAWHLRDRAPYAGACVLFWSGAALIPLVIVQTAAARTILALVAASYAITGVLTVLTLCDPPRIAISPDIVWLHWLAALCVPVSLWIVSLWEPEE